MIDYDIGDVISYRVGTACHRIVRVTRRVDNIVGRGRPGFEGLVLPDEVQSVWGYDHEIVPTPPLIQLAGAAE